MGHDHDHHHDANEYYIEQLCSIGFGGLLAAIVCVWYFSGKATITDTGRSKISGVYITSITTAGRMKFFIAAKEKVIVTDTRTGTVIAEVPQDKFQEYVARLQTPDLTQVAGLAGVLAAPEGFAPLLAVRWAEPMQGTRLQDLRVEIVPENGLMEVVLAGGIGLLVLICFRAVVVWRAAGQPDVAPDHGPEHDHGHDHGHEHGPACHHEHDHGPEHAHGIATAATVSPTLAVPHSHTHGGHDHDHAWAPWRYMVMLVPIILGFLGLPAQGRQQYTEDLRVSDSDTPRRYVPHLLLQPYPGDEGNSDAERAFGPTQVTGLAGMLAAPGGYAPLLAAFGAEPEHALISADESEPTPMDFRELENATLTPEQQNLVTGRKISITGQFAGNNDRVFTLSRFKINCCGADAIQLKALIAIDYSQNRNGDRLDPQALRGQWLRVQGLLQFKDRGNGSFIPLIVVTPTSKHPLKKLVEQIDAPANPYIQ